MKNFLIFSGFLLGTLVAPVVVTAADHADKRYYDKNGHDYHTWNSNEDRAYRSYLGEQHQDYREFKTVKPAQQQQYFTWRHAHPDSTLFKVDIR